MASLDVASISCQALEPGAGAGRGETVFAPCTDVFLEPDGRGRDHVRINQGLMRDALHPTVKGYGVLAACIKRGMAEMPGVAGGGDGDGEGGDTGEMV